MNQLFYNIADGIVHQIRREKRTTISEVIVCGERNIKKIKWFYCKFSVVRVFICLVLPECLLSKFVAFHPWTVKRTVTTLMPSLLFRCFSLFLPHLRTLAQEERSQNCPRFGTGAPSLCLYPLLSRNIIFFPALTMAARAKKKFLAKRFAQAISVHYWDFEHAYVY